MDRPPRSINPGGADLHSGARSQSEYHATSTCAERAVSTERPDLHSIHRRRIRRRVYHRPRPGAWLELASTKPGSFGRHVRQEHDAERGQHGISHSVLAVLVRFPWLAIPPCLFSDRRIIFSYSRQWPGDSLAPVGSRAHEDGHRLR